MHGWLVTSTQWLLHANVTIFPPVNIFKGIRCILLLARFQKYFFIQLYISLLAHKTVTSICTCLLPTVLLLHRRVGQLLSVDDQVSVVSGFECKASVTDPAAVGFLLVLLHDVLQVLFSFCKWQLETRSRTCVICVGHRDTWSSMWLQSFSVTDDCLLGIFCSYIYGALGHLHLHPRLFRHCRPLRCRSSWWSLPFPARPLRLCPEIKGCHSTWWTPGIWRAPEHFWVHLFSSE